MKSVNNILNLLMGLIVLVLSLGIPVIDHIHISENKSNTVSHNDESIPICESSISCCESKAEATIQTQKISSECNCNLMASCCCCLFEVNLHTFSFDTPLNNTIEIPDFLQAFSVDINASAYFCANNSYSLDRYELPPLIPYSQQLPVFQVFRL